MEKNNKLTFRRIHGRIVPIRMKDVGPNSPTKNLMVKSQKTKDPTAPKRKTQKDFLNKEFVKGVGFLAAGAGIAAVGGFAAAKLLGRGAAASREAIKNIDNANLALKLAKIRASEAAAKILRRKPKTINPAQLSLDIKDVVKQPKHVTHPFVDLFAKSAANEYVKTKKFLLSSKAVRYGTVGVGGFIGAIGVRKMLPKNQDDVSKEVIGDVGAGTAAAVSSYIMMQTIKRLPKATQLGFKLRY